MRIEITGVDLKAFAKKVYELSQPRGLGFLHFKPGPLSDDEVRPLLSDGHTALNMDYVKGRGCKMHVFRDAGKLFITSPWFDHTDEELHKLLTECGMTAPPAQKPHVVSCECDNCNQRRSSTEPG
jgi:hypothetical protein